MKKIHCKTLSASVFAALALLLVGCASPTKTAESKKYSDRDRANLLVTAAVGAMKDNDPIAALEYLQRAEQIDPKYSAVFHARTQAFLMKKDQARAMESIERALTIAPNDSGVLNTAGKMKLDAGRFAEAEAHLKKAAEDPMFREGFKAKTSLGILYYRKSQFDLAETYLSRAVDEQPTQACIAHYYKGHIAMKRGRVTDAQRSYERASSRVCANFADAHYAHGIALERAKSYDLARRKYLELQQVFPDSPFAEQAMLRLKQLP